MNTPNQKSMMITNSLLWAAAMIASSLIVKDAEQASSLLLIFISLWFASSTMIQANGDTIKSEWVCIQKFFTKKD